MSFEFLEDDEIPYKNDDLKRLQFYQEYGFTKQELKDSDANIRKEARAFWAIQNIQNYKDDYDNHIVNKVVQYAKRIEDNHRIDNEVAHVDEDDMMYFIIENMHNLYGEDITIVQEIVKNVNSLPYSRWYA